MVLPRVLVGCPTAVSHDYCLKEYADAVKSLSYPNYDILIVDNSEGNEYFNKIKSLGLNVVKDDIQRTIKEKVIHSRNILRQKVLDGGYDYFLSLEQDVIPPKDVIEQLIMPLVKHKKKIISGVYYGKRKLKNGEIKLMPLLWAWPTDDKSRFYTKVRPFNIEDVEEPKILDVKICGLGCVLMHRSVLEKIKFRCEKEKVCFDDVFFSFDALSEGFGIIANTAVKCQHLVNKRPWNWEDLLNGKKDAAA